MRKIKVFTDSTCDLPVDIVDKYDITVVPLYVDFGEENYKDGVDLHPAQLFTMVKEKGVLPKTSSPSPYDFKKYFQEYIELERDIIVITISAKMSSTYQNALLAAADFPAGRIWVVDSQNITLGIGSLVMIAGEMAQEGKNPQEIVTRLDELIPKVRVNFVIDTLEYLYKGGRCNVVQTLFGTALRIRPVVGVEEGSMLVAAKIRGDKKRALNKLIETVTDNKGRIGFNRIFVMNSCGGDEEAAYVRDCLNTVFADTEIIMAEAGCVISSHCGEKTVGISYITQ